MTTTIGWIERGRAGPDELAPPVGRSTADGGGATSARA